MIAPTEAPALIESSSSSADTYVSVVDEDYYEKYCKEVEITDKIDMGMIVDFVQNHQTFTTILPVLNIEPNKKN